VMTEASETISRIMGGTMPGRSRLVCFLRCPNAIQSDPSAYEASSGLEYEAPVLLWFPKIPSNPILGLESLSREISREF
jgi:hypothetical protein